MIENTSGLEPRGKAILIQSYEPEIRRGIIELPPEVAGRQAMVEQRAIVIAIGNDAWSDEPEPRALPGDKVMVTKFAGMMAVGPKDGQQYRLCNDRDVFCRITSEAQP